MDKKQRNKVREALRLATRDFITATSSATDWVTEPGMIVLTPRYIAWWQKAVGQAFPPSVASGVEQAITEKLDDVCKLVQEARQVQGALARKRQKLLEEKAGE